MSRDRSSLSNASAVATAAAHARDIAGVNQESSPRERGLQRAVRQRVRTDARIDFVGASISSDASEPPAQTRQTETEQE